MALEFYIKDKDLGDKCYTCKKKIAVIVIFFGKRSIKVCPKCFDNYGKKKR